MANPSLHLITTIGHLANAHLTTTRHGHEPGDPTNGKQSEITRRAEITKNVATKKSVFRGQSSTNVVVVQRRDLEEHGGVHHTDFCLFPLARTEPSSSRTSSGGLTFRRSTSKIAALSRSMNYFRRSCFLSATQNF